jgi:hypothetical protein
MNSNSYQLKFLFSITSVKFILDVFTLQVHNAWSVKKENTVGVNLHSSAN